MALESGQILIVGGYTQLGFTYTPKIWRLVEGEGWATVWSGTPGPEYYNNQIKEIDGLPDGSFTLAASPEGTLVSTDFGETWSIQDATDTVRVKVISSVLAYRVIFNSGYALEKWNGLSWSSIYSYLGAPSIVSVLLAQGSTQVIISDKPGGDYSEQLYEYNGVSFIVSALPFPSPGLVRGVQAPTGEAWVFGERTSGNEGIAIRQSIGNWSYVLPEEFIDGDTINYWEDGYAPLASEVYIVGTHSHPRIELVTRWNGSAWVTDYKRQAAYLGDPAVVGLHTITGNSSIILIAGDKGVIRQRTGVGVWNDFVPAHPDIGSSLTGLYSSLLFSSGSSPEPPSPPPCTVCTVPLIDSDFTLNHYICLPNQFVHVNGGALSTVPYFLGHPGFTKRQAAVPYSGSID